MDLRSTEESLRSYSLIRCSTLFLVVIAASVPWLGYYAWNLKVGATFVDSWLPTNDQAKLEYRAFREQFGEDQYLIVAWPTGTLTDPRITEFRLAMEEVEAQFPDLGIEQVNDSRSSLDALQQTGIARGEAVERLTGIAVGQGGEGFLTLRLAQASAAKRAELIDRIRAIADSVLGAESEDLILAGEPFQVYQIDRSSRQAMRRLVPPSSVLALLIATLALRSLKLTLLVFTFAGLGQLIGMSTVSFFLGEMIAVLVVLPTLVFMLVLSASVHLANYYRDAQQHAATYASTVALNRGFLPCSLATVTTAFGFASLYTSQLGPVWQFGSLSAFALIVATAITLGGFPAMAELLERVFGARRKDRNTRASDRSTTSVIECESVVVDEHVANATVMTSSGSKIEGLMVSGLVAFTSRFATPISLVGVALLGIGLLGLPRLETSTSFKEMFLPESEPVRSLEWVENHLGPIEVFEYLLSFPASQSRAQAMEIPEADEMQAQLDCIRGVANVLERESSVMSVASAVTFLPPAPSGSGLRATIARSVYKQKLHASWQDLENDGLLNSDAGSATWRVSVRARISEGRAGAVRTQLSKAVDDAAQQYSDRPVVVTTTGMQVVIEHAHRAMIRDLATSFATAFLLITPIMMIVARSIPRGMLLMIPNVLPVVIVFGAMGWIGTSLDVASILTASVALGIAVDDTLHFVVAYYRAMRSGASINDSVRKAIATCARPMLHTTLICSAAMSPFFWSDFLPTSKFALLMILILIGAIVGDLLLLPGLLLSPLGRWMSSQHASASRQSQSD